MIERLKYKGHDILRLIDDTNQRRSIQFGVDKARIINANQAQIAEFIADVDKNKALETVGEAIAGAGNTDDQPVMG